MSDATKPLLIFDLDETLIHASETKLTHQEDYSFDLYFIYERPYLREVLTDLSQHFTLSVWSSADDDYVAFLADKIKPAEVDFAFAWGNSRCTLRFDPESASHFKLKNLKKIKRKGFSLRRTLIVDNTPAKVSANYGNAIYIPDFTGDQEDRELLKLRDYLLLIKDQEDFTRIEKRSWQSKV